MKKLRSVIVVVCGKGYFYLKKEMVNEKPSWMKSYTTDKGRYSHAYATYEEIPQQKASD